MKKPRSPIIVILVILFFIVGTSIFLYLMMPEKKNDIAKDVPEDSTTSLTYSKPSVIFTEHITPCEVTVNQEFWLESDDSIAQKFPGIDDVVIYSGRGKSDIPVGRWKGPISFYDPKDSLNGHKSFRIYRRNG
jgi:hypothetical protein